MYYKEVSNLTKIPSGIIIPEGLIFIKVRRELYYDRHE